MRAYMFASYIGLEVDMDGWMWNTGVSSTLRASYACMAEASTPERMHVCYRHALLLYASFSRRLPVAGARLSARWAARWPLPEPV